MLILHLYFQPISWRKMIFYIILCKTISLHSCNYVTWLAIKDEFFSRPLLIDYSLLELVLALMLLSTISRVLIMIIWHRKFRLGILRTAWVVVAKVCIRLGFVPNVLSLIDITIVTHMHQFWPSLALRSFLSLWRCRIIRFVLERASVVALAKDSISRRWTLILISVFAVRFIQCRNSRLIVFLLNWYFFDLFFLLSELEFDLLILLALCTLLKLFFKPWISLTDFRLALFRVEKFYNFLSLIFS